MKPKFSMTSDSTEPEIKGCTAYWEFSGGASSQKFLTGADAFSMNGVVTAAYEAGLADGRRDVARAVIQTATEQSA